MFVVDTSKKLVDLLVRQGRLKKEVADSWGNLSNFEVEQKLKAEKMLSDEDIARSYAQLYSLPYVSLKNRPIDSNVLSAIPREIALKFQIVAYDLAENASLSDSVYKQTLFLAVASPAQLSANATEVLSSLEKKKHLRIQLAVTTADDLKSVLAKIPVQTPSSVPAPTSLPAAPPVKPVSQPVSEEKNQPQTESKPSFRLSLTNPIVNLRTIDLDKIQIPYEVVCKFPEDIARKYRMIVFEAPHPSFIKVAVADPYDKKIREILGFVKEKNDIAIQEFIATPEQINRAMKYYKKPAPPVVPAPEIKPVNPPKPPEASLQKVQPIQPQPPEKPQEQSQIKPQIQPVEKLPEKLPERFQEQPIRPTFTTNQSSQPKISPRRFVMKPKLQEPAPKVEVTQQKPVPTVEGAPQKPIQAMAAQENNLDKFLGEEVKTVEDLQAICETGNVPKIVAAAVALAVLKKASDIHVESEEKDLRIRFRVDGILKDIIRLPLSIQPAVISRIKILSKLKIDETRIPQDGRFDVTTRGHAIDLRVSTLPTVHGEKAAMRILDKSAHIYTLEELGFVGRNLQAVIENINKPYGVVLSTGPTGSGKSTTLYAILNRISNTSVNIVTLEDPVEYEVPGINQCQIKPKIGFTFANGLRSILRQDPNIIMVGEIRDSETASLATHAALTGHLVLSSLHTNDSAGALPRMMNMGVEPFLITSSINVIIAQRLVRKLCPKCVRPARIPEPIMRDIEKELAGFNLPTPYQFLEGKGCDACENGYSGRIGIFEVLVMTDKIEAAVIARKTSSEIKTEAIREGMTTMKQDGLIKALKGQTSVNDVLRVMTI